MHTHDLIRQRLLQRAGLVPRPKAPFEGRTFDELHAQECSDGFCEMMDNRLVMGVMRYGPMKRKVAHFADLKKAMTRLDSYNLTGNTELLVDAANYLRAEFNRSQHPNRHFHSVDRTT